MPDFFGAIGTIGQTAAKATVGINWGQTLLNAGVTVGTSALSALIAKQLAPSAPKQRTTTTTQIPQSTAQNMAPAVATAQLQQQTPVPVASSGIDPVIVYGSIFLLATVVLLRK